MGNKRKVLEAEDQRNAIDKMMKFKEIHEGIAKLERQMGYLKEQKDLLVTDLDLARADDEYFHAKLEEKYGPGKLDPTNLEWVANEDESNEDTEEDIRLSEDA